MPHANIWIRKQDYDKWEKIPNKSEFISQALRGEKLEAVYIEETVTNQVAVVKKPIKQEMTNDEIAVAAFNGVSTKDFVTTGTLTCKDGHPSRDGKYCSNIKCSYFN